MSERRIDQVEQLQRVGIGLTLGGIAFGGLSFGVEAFVGGIALLVAGIAVWWGEYRANLMSGLDSGSA